MLLQHVTAFAGHAFGGHSLLFKEKKTVAAWVALGWDEKLISQAKSEAANTNSL